MLAARILSRRHRRPDRAVVAFDAPGNWRLKLLPSYKMHRAPTHEALRPQLERLPDSLVGVAEVVRAPGFEADDVLGALDLAARGFEKLVSLSVSNDTARICPRGSRPSVI